MRGLRTWMMAGALTAGLVGPAGAAIAVAPADVAAIDRALDTMSPEIVRTMPGPHGPGITSGGGGCACALGARGLRSGAAAALLLGPGGAALLLGRRRRPRA